MVKFHEHLLKGRENFSHDWPYINLSLKWASVVKLDLQLQNHENSLGWAIGLGQPSWPRMIALCIAIHRKISINFGHFYMLGSWPQDGPWGERYNPPNMVNNLTKFHKKVPVKESHEQLKHLWTSITPSIEFDRWTCWLDNSTVFNV